MTRPDVCRRCSDRSTARTTSRSVIAASYAFVAMLCLPLTADAQVGGVRVDPQGVLREVARVRVLSEVSVDAEPNEHVRLVSLRQLQSEIVKLPETRDYREWPAEVRSVGNLVRLQGVRLTMDAGVADVYLVGESDEPNPENPRIGIRTGRPFLAVDDLIHALRFAFAEDPPDGFIGCSIDPSEAGVRRYQAALSRVRRQLNSARAASALSALQRAIGPQQIRVFGVPGESRFALKLVAADYRLKRLAMGLDPSPLEDVPSYFDMQASQRTARTIAQHRWWFVPRLQAVEHDQDRQIFRLVGSAVAVETGRLDEAQQEVTGTSPAVSNAVASRATANQAAQRLAVRRRDGASDTAAQQFASRLTRNFPLAAARIQVFADLQNLMDLSLIAEIIAVKVFDEGNAQWSPKELLADATYDRLPRGYVPQTVASISRVQRVNAKSWLISFSGGVEISPRRTASADVWRTGQSPAFSRWADSVSDPALGDRLFIDSRLGNPISRRD